jgi:hypothetical protein
MRPTACTSQALLLLPPTLLLFAVSWTFRARRDSVGSRVSLPNATVGLLTVLLPAAALAAIDVQSCACTDGCSG